MNDKNQAVPEEKDENTIIAERRAKLAAIREKGIAFPNDCRPHHNASDLHEKFGEAERESLERVKDSRTRVSSTVTTIPAAG